MPDELTKVAKMEAEDICIGGCSVAYVPIIGYLLMTTESIKIPQDKLQLVELVRLYGFRILFSNFLDFCLRGNVLLQDETNALTGRECG